MWVCVRLGSPGRPSNPAYPLFQYLLLCLQCRTVYGHPLLGALVTSALQPFGSSLLLNNLNSYVYARSSSPPTTPYECKYTWSPVAPASCCHVSAISVGYSKPQISDIFQTTSLSQWEAGYGVPSKAVSSSLPI